MSYMSLNDNKYIGTLKDDPQLTKSIQGKSLCRFTIVCERKDMPGIKDYIPCLAIGKIAENIVRNLRKGSFLYIQGQNQSYTKTIEGTVIHGTEIYVKDVIFLNQPKEGDSYEK